MCQAVALNYCSVSRSSFSSAVIATQCRKNRLPELELVAEVDGAEVQKSQMKSIMFPLMDDPDALPSTYIQRVLIALAKWSCKMQALVDAIASVDTPTKSIDTLLSSIQPTIFPRFPEHISTPCLSKSCGTVASIQGCLLALSRLTRRSLR